MLFIFMNFSREKKGFFRFKKKIKYIINLLRIVPWGRIISFWHYWFNHKTMDWEIELQFCNHTLPTQSRDSFTKDGTASEFNTWWLLAFFFFAGLGKEPRACHRLSEHSATELHPDLELMC